MVNIKIPYKWKPRKYQMKLWHYLENGGKRAVAVWHRRAGKDSLSLNWTAVAAMQRVGVYWHMLPLQTQARKVVWDAIDKQGRRVIDQVFPKALRKSVNAQEMKIELLNGSIWQCVGSDNYNSLVGANPVGVVFPNIRSPIRRHGTLSARFWRKTTAGLCLFIRRADATTD